MKADASPTARALLTLELLQGSPGITADRLADRLGVTERAARRYIGILREAGVPIESVRGPFGGYRLGRGVRLPPLMFSAAEALGLVMAVLDGHHDPSDAADPVGSALGKIIRVLPEGVAAQMDAVRRTTAPAPDRGAARPDPDTTSTLVQACATRRMVRLDYRSEAGSEWVCEVEPWAVVVRHGRWYLLCRNPDTDARRAYRIDRVRAVEVLGTELHPAQLNSTRWRCWRNIWPLAGSTTSMSSSMRRRRMSRAGCPVHSGGWNRWERAPPGWSARTGNPWWYAEQLVVIPVPYRIVGCRELQQTARVLAQRMLTASGEP